MHGHKEDQPGCALWQYFLRARQPAHPCPPAISCLPFRTDNLQSFTLTDYLVHNPNYCPPRTIFFSCLRRPITSCSTSSDYCPRVRLPYWHRSKRLIIAELARRAPMLRRWSWRALLAQQQRGGGGFL